MANHQGITASNLVTTRLETIQGFLDQSREKDRRSQSYITEAKDFYCQLRKFGKIEDAVNSSGALEKLLTACGLSDKAKQYFDNAQGKDALSRLLKSMAESSDWQAEIIYRYLLTRGDSLGGSMRNWIGASAGKMLADSILQALDGKRIKYQCRYSKKEKVQEIWWPNRVLIFDKKPKLIANNTDAILLKTSNASETLGTLIERKSCYLACGELKGGIDPAGADEHWKTAVSAINRLYEVFNNTVSYFFVGAAIETRMADDIIRLLQNGRLHAVANLNKPEQLKQFSDWLVSL